VQAIEEEILPSEHRRRTAAHSPFDPHACFRADNDRHRSTLALTPGDRLELVREQQARRARAALAANHSQVSEEDFQHG
jgi:hypothetical protein